MNQWALSGAKIILRAKRGSDAAEDYEWRSDYELAELDDAPIIRINFQEYLYQYQEELQFPSSWSRRFAIDTIEGLHIGNCMYYEVNFIDNSAELGILLGNRDYWDKGYGTDAVIVLLNYIFGDTQLGRVYLHTLSWNIRAQKSFEKTGFIGGKTVNRNGKQFLRMEITRKRWLELQKDPQILEVIPIEFGTP